MLPSRSARSSTARSSWGSRRPTRASPATSDRGPLGRRRPTDAPSRPRPRCHQPQVGARRAGRRRVDVHRRGPGADALRRWAGRGRAQLGRVAAEIMRSTRRSCRVGVGVPGPVRPGVRVTGSWSTCPAAGEACRSRARWAQRWGCRRRSSTTHAHSGWRSSAWAPDGVSVDDRPELGTGIGGVIVSTGRLLHGLQGHGRRARPPGRSIPMGRCATAATAAVSRRSAGPPSRRLRHGDREVAVTPPGRATPRPSAGWRGSAGTWASASPTPSCLTPERVVLGGGVAGAGELLLARPRRDRAAGPYDRLAAHGRRPRGAGHGAGAIGAAVHGAERAASLQGGGLMTASTVQGRLVLADRVAPGAWSIERRSLVDMAPDDGPGRGSFRAARVRGRPRPWLGRPRRDGWSRGARRHGPDAVPPRCHLVPADGGHGADPDARRLRGDGAGVVAGRPRRWRPRPLASTSKGPFISDASAAPTTRRTSTSRVDVALGSWSRWSRDSAIMTVAPELPGALDLIALAHGPGRGVSLGHSAATRRPRRAPATGPAARPRPTCSMA